MGWWKRTVQFCGDLADTLPAVGHIKGVVHYAVGDIEGGNKAVLSATRSTAVIGAGVAGFLAGPVGAIAAGAGAGAAFDVAAGVATGFENAQGIARIIDKPADLGSWVGAGIDVGGDMLAGLGGGALINNLGKEAGKQAGKAVAKNTAKKLAVKLAPQVIQGAVLAKGIAAVRDRQNKWSKVSRKWKVVSTFKRPQQAKTDELSEVDFISSLIHQHKIPVQEGYLQFKSNNDTKQTTNSGRSRGKSNDQSNQDDGDHSVDRESAGAGQPPERKDNRQEDKESKSAQQLTKELKQLLQKLLQIIQANGQLTVEEMGYYFELLIDYLHTLIHVHGAELHRDSRYPENIFVEIGSDRIEINGRIRDLFHFEPVTSELSGSANDAIYGIWCNQCERYVYAGQSVSVQQRASSHQTTMKKDTSLLGQHARDHGIDDYKQVYRMDILTRVDLGRSNFKRLTAGSAESKKLRSWEVFFQWLFKALVGEGGFSKK